MSCTAKTGAGWLISLMVASVYSLPAIAGDVEKPVTPAKATGSKANGSKMDTAPNKAASPTTADLDFLEYLGTMESDEDNWTDLANDDVAAAAKASPVVQPATTKPASVNRT